MCQRSVFLPGHEIDVAESVDERGAQGMGRVVTRAGGVANQTARQCGRSSLTHRRADINPVARCHRDRLSPVEASKNDLNRRLDMHAQHIRAAG